MFPPERIVCLTEETVETLYLLGEDRRIVGVSGYAVRPPQVRREKPRVSAFISADVPKIIDLKPDLVVMDADMPGMSGLRTALLLSQMAPATEVILMSMDTGPRFRAACAGCGAKAVIYKPRFLRELSALLQRPLRPSLHAEPMAAGV